MFAFLARRSAQSVLTRIIVITGTFGIIQLAPGGPAIMMDPDLTAEARQWIERSLGLDQPIHVQYGRWLGAMIQGDFGMSFSDRSPVMETIAQTLPNTLQLSLAALVVTILLGIPMGVLAALKRNTVTDQFLAVGSFIGLSVPSFWFGIMLILLLSVNLGLLPGAGMKTFGAPDSLVDRLRHLVMPVAVLALSDIAIVIRYTRSSLLNVVNDDYVRTARAKGVTGTLVVYKHALRNALIPVITVIGLRIPILVGGTVVTESVFAWPGMGRLALNAALERDYPLIMGITVIMATIVLVVNLLVDLSYSLIDPRVRHG